MIYDIEPKRKKKVLAAIAYFKKNFTKEEMATLCPRDTLIPYIKENNSKFFFAELSAIFAVSEGNGVIN